jgi:IPT/TIG domain-containing protein
MRKSSSLVAVLSLLAASAPLFAQATIPQMQTVDPASAKTGDVVTVTGENLDQNVVAALFLTNGKDDFKVEITEQSATAIKFKIPAAVKTGRLALMVLTKGKEPKLIEEPVKVLIEAPMTPPTGY